MAVGDAVIDVTRSFTLPTMNLVNAIQDQQSQSDEIKKRAATVSAAEMHRQKELLKKKTFDEKIHHEEKKISNNVEENADTIIQMLGEIAAFEAEIQQLENKMYDKRHEAIKDDENYSAKVHSIDQIDNNVTYEAFVRKQILDQM